MSERPWVPVTVTVTPGGRITRITIGDRDISDAVRSASMMLSGPRPELPSVHAEIAVDELVITPEGDPS